MRGRDDRVSAGDRVVGMPARRYEHDRVREQHDRHEEVRHHEAGLQLEEHGEPTEHRLREHAADQTERQPHQVACAAASRTRLPSTATITAIDTSPVNMRFTNSTIGCSRTPSAG